jgi:hypothetical protein
VGVVTAYRGFREIAPIIRVGYSAAQEAGEWQKISRTGKRKIIIRGSVLLLIANGWAMAFLSQANFADRIRG